MFEKLDASAKCSGIAPFVLTRISCALLEHSSVNWQFRFRCGAEGSSYCADGHTLRFHAWQRLNVCGSSRKSRLAAGFCPA